MIDEIKIVKKNNGVEIISYESDPKSPRDVKRTEYVARFAPLDDYARKDGKAFNATTIGDLTEVLKPLLEQMDAEYVAANRPASETKEDKA